MTYTYARRYRGPLKAVILDWAGTTLDYGCCAPAVVFTEVFKRQGVEISIVGTIGRDVGARLGINQPRGPRNQEGGSDAQS